MKLKFFVLFFLTKIFLSYSSFGNAPIIYSDGEKNIEIGGYIEILEDPSNTLTFSEVLNSNTFKQSTQKVPNLEISNSSFWARFQIKNLSKTQQLLLEYPYPIIDEVELYTIGNNGKYSVEKTGEYIPYYKRNYKHQNYIFDLHIPSNETRTYILKIRGSEQMQIPLVLGTSKSVFENLINNDLIFGLYAGIILVMFFYNLIVYFVVKNKVYLYYVVYILFVGLTQACLQGYAFKYFWPDSPTLANLSMVLAPSLAGVAAIEFLRNFLQVKENTPSLHKILYIFIIAYVICIIIGLTKNYRISQQLIQLNAMLASLFLFLVGYRIARKGYRPAVFFLIAWSIFLISVIVFVLRNLNFLPYNNFTFYALQIGSGLEVILLSFALADRINILKKEKEESQAEALRALKANEDIIKQQNVILDIKVTERTEELQNSNMELNHTLKNLKETQSKLVDAEKMASLGQLTAGIAHEINNPINFVSSSVKPLKRDIDDLLSILDKYDELSSDGNIDEKLKDIKNFKRKLDFDYLKQEINTLLTGIDDGASRTAEIVKGLRNFSRMDESDLKMTDIHEGIDSSLVLLNSALGGRIDILKEYGNIPSIECYAGKLNQVFMNILTNASQAISSNKEANGKGNINIKTFEKGENIVISIKDTGMGMPEDVKNKIFEPFFTTKDVGEGTGLGLSIVFSIIEAHKGNIMVESEMGKGTEFIITLPKIHKS